LGPRQYLLACENLEAFDEISAVIADELQPADPIERMWVGEVIDLEWTIHRLRSVRRSTLEKTLAERLMQLAMNIAEEDVTDFLRPTNFRFDALGFLRGDRGPQNVVATTLEESEISDALQSVQIDISEKMLRLDLSIVAISRQRDAIIDRIYSRREFIAKGRITPSAVGVT
jgi:hypothetical protein